MSRVIDATLRFVDQFTKPMGNAVSKLEQSGRTYKKIGKEIERAGEGIAKTGKTLTKTVTAPIVGLGAMAVKTAAEFDASMSKVESIIGKTVPGEMEKLTEKAKEMGKITKFSASESAEAFSYMAMAGWKTGDMLNSIESVMYLAGAAGTDLARTSDIVTDAMTALGMAADKDYAPGISNAQHFTDVLAATANNANTDVEMLGESFKYCAPLAGAYGFSVDDTALALGLMANAGIKASNSGTAMRKVFAQLSSNMEIAQQDGSKFVVETQNMDGSMRDLKDILDDTRTAFNGISDAEKQAMQGNLVQAAKDLEVALEKDNGVLKTQAELYEDVSTAMDGLTASGKVQEAEAIAGKTAMAGLLSIINASEEDYEKLAGAIGDCNGAAKEMYDVANDNLIGRLTIVKATIESIAIQFGERLMPYVEKGVEKIQQLADKFSSLSDEQVDNIIKWAGIAAVAGPALLVFGKVVGTVGKVIGAFGKFGMAIKSAGGLLALLTGPGAIVIGIIAAIAAGGFLIYKNWDKVKGVFVKVGETIKDAFEKSGASLGGFKDKFSEVKERFAPIIENLGILFELLSEKIGSELERAKNWLTVAFYAFMGVFGAVATFLGEQFSAFMRMFDGLIAFITGVFTGDWEKAWNGIKDIFGGIFDGLVSLAKLPINAVIGLINGAIAGINKINVSIPDWVPAMGGKSLGFNIPAVPMLWRGTDNWKGGPAMIHDRGAEIVDLPNGSRVYPHDKSMQMARAEGKKNISVQIAKIADTVIIREEADVDRIMERFANKLEEVAGNMA